MEYLSYQTTELEQLNAFWTAKEIDQQPECWKKTWLSIREKRADIESFLEKALEASNSRIILTGAGTSAFAAVILLSLVALLLITYQLKSLLV